MSMLLGLKALFVKLSGVTSSCPQRGNSSSSHVSRYCACFIVVQPCFRIIAVGLRPFADMRRLSPHLRKAANVLNEGSQGPTATAANPMVR